MVAATAPLGVHPWLPMVLLLAQVTACGQRAERATADDGRPDDRDAGVHPDGEPDAPDGVAGAANPDAGANVAHCAMVCNALLTVACDAAPTPVSCAETCLTSLTGPCADCALLLHDCLLKEPDPWLCFPREGIVIRSPACPGEQREYRDCIAANEPLP